MKKQLKAWQVALIDCALAGIFLVIFALFDHVLAFPGNELSAIYTSPTPTPTAIPAPAEETALAEASVASVVSVVSVAEATPEPIDEAADKWPTFDFPGVFTDGEVVQTETSYKSANISVTLTHHTSSGKYKQSWFVEEIYVRDIRYMQCVFANDTVGTNELEKFESMASRSNSVAAINTDFYGFGRRSQGLVIRNGVLYRADLKKTDDMMVLFKDGTMKMYSAGTELDCEALIDEGAWQGYSFGPILVVNGEMLKSYEDVSREPRTVFGYIEPGHYKFIVADGGQDGYAKGFTYKGMGEIAVNEGCYMAYNLDGGQSAQMGFMGSFADKPEKNGRRVSDILVVKDSLE